MLDFTSNSLSASDLDFQYLGFLIIASYPNYVFIVSNYLLTSAGLLGI
jgi:hypothetical protein